MSRDQANFAKLVKYVGEIATILPETVCLLPTGANFCLEPLRILSGGGSSSHISVGGDTMIQCISLDEALRNFEPLIKMDIRERVSGMGCQAVLIRQSRPGLAIVLYHRPEHLWRIPLLVKSLNSDGYRLFCGHIVTAGLS